MKILIGGFEPFGDRTVNNAWEVAKKFEGVADIDVVKIPVSFANAHNEIIKHLRQKRYDLILILGETSYTTDKIRLERLAINYKDAVKPDNDGVTADDEALIEDAPAAYFTRFPVKRFLKTLTGNGHKVKITNSTGTFVCNSIYYNILHYLSVNNLPQVALFIHLPVATDIVTLDEMRQTLGDLIKEYQRSYAPPGL